MIRAAANSTAEEGDALYIVESGQARVQMTDSNGKTISLRTLESGDFFGEIAIVTGGERTADVLATTPMTVLRLRSDDYVRYLAHIAEVEQQMNRTAASRAADTIRRAMGMST